jgi:hypothetical protein
VIFHYCRAATGPLFSEAFQATPTFPMKNIFSVPLLLIFILGAMPTAVFGQWTAATLSQGRYSLAAASVGDKVFFAGGYSGSASNVIDIFNNATNSWTTASLSQARFNMAAASAGDKVFIGGGQNATGFSAVVDIYDNHTNTWTTATLSQARTLLVATATKNKIYFAGGETNIGTFSNVVDIYDVQSNTWSTATLSVPRYGLAAVSVGSKVMFGGGLISTGNGYSNVVDILDETTGLWSTATLSVGRAYLAAASAGAKVLFMGGHASASVGLTTVDIYDSSNGTWTTSTISHGRTEAAAGALGNKIFFAGGYDGASLSKVVDIYDVNVNAWTSSSLSVPRNLLAAVAAGNKIFVAGGNGASLSTVVDIYTNALPSITGFTPSSGPPGTSVTITGSNFDSTPGSNTVSFGAVQAPVTSASPTQLKVNVPNGATLQSISVQVNGLTAYSQQQFIPTFNSGMLDANAFTPAVTFNVNTAPRHVAIGDIDGDGKADLAVTNSLSDNVSIFLNASSTSVINTSSFAGKVDLPSSSYPIGVAIYDLDGDGKPELTVVGNGSQAVSVFKNSSTPGTLHFEQKVDFTTGSSPHGVTIADFDGEAGRTSLWPIILDITFQYFATLALLAKSICRRLLPKSTSLPAQTLRT